MTPLMIMLLASIGPLFVAINDFDNDEEPADDAAVDPVVGDENTPDLLDLVDFEARPEEARDAALGPEAFEVTRGTDAAAQFTGDDSLRNVHDASGGEDTLTGGVRDDVLIGGDGSDSISGGQGDDDLFGAFQRATRADDLDADMLDGGDGDDSLFLGTGDTGLGGAGADAFILVQDTTGAVTISDFNPDEDAILIEGPTPETLEIESQTVVDTDLLITLNTGASITLSNVSAALSEDLILFVGVDPIET